MRNVSRLVETSLVLITSLILASCAARRAELSTTGGNVTGPTCNTPLTVTLSRVSTTDPKVGDEVYFRLDASGCSGQYSFSSAGASFSENTPYFYARTYTSPQTASENVQVQDVNFPTKTATAQVSFNVVAVTASSISCAATNSLSTVVLDPATSKATVSITLSATGSASYKVIAYRYISGGGYTLSPATPVPTIAGNNLGLTFNLTAAGQHLFAFDVQDATTASLVATCNTAITVTADSTLSFVNAVEQFGNSVTTSNPVTRAIVATNSGTSNMSVSSVAVSGSSDFTVVSDTCSNGANIAPSQTCSVSIKFNPLSGAGSKSATMTLTYVSASQTPKTAVVSLQGGSQAAVAIALLPTGGLNFGTVVPTATSSPMNVSISNVGPSAARLMSVTVSNSVFKVQSDACVWFPSQGLTLAANTMCNIAFVFNPTSPGSYAATFTLNFQSSSGAAFSSTLAFSGTSAGSADILSLGLYSACAIRSGAAYCWGRNDYGLVGDGSTTDRRVASLVQGLDSGVTSISTGAYHACALRGGAVFCWGYNGYGGLGDNTLTRRLTPVAVSGMTSGVTAIAAGGHSSCAVQNGALKCWGYNGFGQLGDGTNTSRSVPVQVSGMLSGVTAVVISNEPTNPASTVCAIQNGAAKCWGYNGWYNIGDGTTTNRMAPYSVPGFSSGVQAVLPVNGHTCILQNGGMKCWGFGNRGELGDGGSAVRSAPVVPVGMDVGVTAIGGGAENTCAIKAGRLYCWGDNSFGSLGDGTSGGRRLVPTAVLGMDSSVEQVSREGYDHNCAVKQGRLYCWGRNNHFQLGDNTGANRNAPGVVLGW